MRKSAKRVVFTSLFLMGSVFAGSTLACTTDGWDGVSGTGVADSPGAVARYSELCAFEISDGSYVESQRAVSDARYIARFYVLDGLSGSGAVDILQAYSDDGATSPLFKVSFDGTDFTFNAENAGGQSATAASEPGWNLVEFDWDSGTNTFSYWVNADASTDPATGSIEAGAGTVEAIRLGAPNGYGTQAGDLTFDAFESHRSTPVGALKAADANNDGAVNILDLGNIRIELLNPGDVASLAIGQPDCNSDGAINILDVGCVRLLLLN